MVTSSPLNKLLDKYFNLQSKSNQHINQSAKCGCKLDINQPFIGNYHDAPIWLRKNHLKLGYRINFSSIKLIIKSFFMVHNETFNVWSHLIGLILLVLIGCITCTDSLKLLRFQTNYQNLAPQQPYPMGSGKTFIQNITHTTFDQQYLSHNQRNQYALNDRDQLAYDICQNSKDKHQCYLRKSHQRKFRNWLQFQFGICLDDLQKTKLKMQKQLIPTFVHELQNQIKNQSHLFTNYLQEFIHLHTNENLTSQKLQLHFQNFSQQNSHNSNKSGQIFNNIEELAKWPLICFLICNGICLICSTINHLFNPMSYKVHQLCVCTDFAGISFLCGGNSIPYIYYGMYCYFQVAQLYLILLIGASAFIFVISFTQKFKNRQNSLFRSVVYLSNIGLNIVPLIHIFINETIFNNYNDSFTLASSVQWYVLGYGLYVIGGLIYALHIPDKYSKTGRFDNFGHSHHIWHLFVVSAMIAMYIGCVQNYFKRLQSVCGA